MLSSNITSIVTVLISQSVLRSKSALICQHRGIKAAVSLELNIGSPLTHTSLNYVILGYLYLIVPPSEQ